MAKLHFYYSAMNAGKSTNLLQSSYNYRERGMKTLLLVPAIDDRYGKGKIASRIGLSDDAVTFDRNDNLFEIVKKYPDIKCVFLDEAQFVTKDQAWQLTDVVDRLNIPVLAYGLRTDFQGNTFEGSQPLLAWAEDLVEIKTICHCGRKATMNIRTDEHGKKVKEGEQIVIGGNDRYIAVCRKHFKEME